MATQRLTHAQREGLVMQEVQGRVSHRQSSAGSMKVYPFVKMQFGHERRLTSAS
jgi:hypothetical protein